MQKRLMGRGNSIQQKFLDAFARSTPLATRLTRRKESETLLVSHAVESAHPFIAAYVAGAIKSSLWIVCGSVKQQEIFYGELLNWITDALIIPEVELAIGEAVQADPETTAERLAVLQQLATSRKKQVLVLTAASLDSMAPSPGGLSELLHKVSRGTRLDHAAFVEELVNAGYERVAQVTARGQFAVRGGILDLFSSHQPLPVRLEFFGDEVDSIRQFDIDNQTSVEELDSCSLMLGEPSGATVPLRDYIKSGDFILDAGAEIANADIALTESAPADAPEDFSAAFFPHELGEFEAGDLIVQDQKREQLFRQLEEWRRGGWKTAIFCHNEGEIERLHDLLPAALHDGVDFPIGEMNRGWIYPAAKLAVVSASELFGRYRNTRTRRAGLARVREQAHRAQIDFASLEEGDYVVHLEHGIGRYLGLQETTSPDGKTEEVLAIEFDAGARLFVPLEQSFLVSRYVGVGKKVPALSNLGDARWAKARKQAERAVFDYAGRLLALHAERETVQGFAFPPDTRWQQEFENSFLYKETPDQLTSIAATKADMESPRPMDRLICGDVGFGKTEVAIRAAFKAVMGGKQVALLAPTTVLAQQHYQNFRERMSDYPITVDVLSRFRTQREQRETLQRVAEGTVDIVIGTHRLLSKDVVFKDLGLAIVDEEQRFGVLHKERFKTLFKLVDVLTLSATPIPRTLYLSLMGAKDMSVIETPPVNRIPTETVICPYDERVIRDAIRRELQRGGQVYFLHNRIGSIERVMQRIVQLCPDAKVEIGHGQMDEGELEEVMQRFVSGQTDVLVSTTIIESGLDIPNANTIIIDRADRFGLADLYQLRGRVGRAQQKAYAYLMLPREMITVGAARKRINAIKQYSSLGAGFKIAMRDLEIRGAGNILGTAQSGHIVAIGFDLYCQLLRQAVAKLKGETRTERVEVPVRLDFVATNEAEFAAGPAPVRVTGPESLQEELTGPKRLTPAFLPSAYIGDSPTRIQAYRHLAEVQSQPQLDALAKAWRDRFGEFPEAVSNLLLLAEIKLIAASRRITSIEVKDGKVMARRVGDFILVGGKFPRLSSKGSDLDLRDLSTLIRTL
jgi:transcription-repair coupling factor (superfamily II helicase)